MSKDEHVLRDSVIFAVHIKHGLAWTDGHSIYLAPINVIDDEVENDESVKLGEFDYVQSVHWSCDLGDFCYLCVVHQTTVSLWKVNGASPDLQFKQVRKINATPISQGVLWSPRRDILCVLSRDQCSFYFRHIQNKGSYALPPIESGKIYSGCWSLDGSKLVVGVGSIILIYQWADIDRTIQEYTIIAWKIPHVDGQISALCAVSETRILCTTELPLEALCRAAQKDMFEGPDLSNANNLNREGGNNGPLNIIHEGRQTHRDKLMNLTRTQNPVNDTSQLVLFEIQGHTMEPSKIASIKVKGILVPDLLHYDSRTEHAVVGSNTQVILSVFHVGSTDVTKVNEIKFHKDERPKGVCGICKHRRHMTDGVLVLVGRDVKTDATFLPSASRSSYRLQLQFHFLLPSILNQHQAIKTSNDSCAVPHMENDGYIGGRGMIPVMAEDDPYPEHLFNELLLPGANTKVHLLRFGPLQSGCINNDDLSIDSATLMETPSHTDLVTNAHNFSHHNNNQSEVPQIDLKLPGDTIKSIPKSKIQFLSEQGIDIRDLETETVSFRDTVPKFESPFHTDKKDMAPGEVNLIDSLPNCKNKLALKNLIGQRTIGSHMSEWGSGVNCQANECDEPESVKHVRSTPDGSISRSASEVLSAVSSLESEIRVQGGHISQLQGRIEEISRLLEETQCVGNNQYQPATSPELVHLVWRSDDGSQVVKKTFILDAGRLQLEPVKQAFGLLTVELIVDGVACVLGCNIDGYIPVRFSPSSTMEIKGQPAS